MSSTKLPAPVTSRGSLTRLIDLPTYRPGCKVLLIPYPFVCLGVQVGASRVRPAANPGGDNRIESDTQERRPRNRRARTCSGAGHRRAGLTLVPPRTGR